MNTTERIILFIFGFHKTLYFNFKCLPFNKAIKLPVFLARNVKLVKLADITINGSISTGMIKIGFGDIGIFDATRSTTIIKNKGNIIFEGKANLGHGTKVNVNENATLCFGQDIVVSGESSFICSKKIVVGDGCLISWDVLIMDTDFHKVYHANNNEDNYVPAETSKPIMINKNVWIGCRCLIMKGVVIQEGCIISAGTKLYKSVDAKRVIIGGDKNLIIKENVLWEH